MLRRRILAAFLVGLPMLAHCWQDAVAATAATPTQDAVLERVLARLDALEQHNEQLALQVAELRRQNGTLLAGGPGSAPPNAGAVPAAQAASGTGAVAAKTAPSDGASRAAEDWASRIRFGGDFRFRHESIDNGLLADDRTRETIRARFGATIRVSDSIDGEIAIASGGAEPRGASSTLGAASSRKDIGLDLAYMTWRPLEGLGVTLGKMREPYLRPGRSLFFDNELRPEGIAAAYKAANGLFGSAYRFWLEERAEAGDSTMAGAQIGWDGALRGAKLKFGAGYYDYQGIEGRFPGFAASLVNEFGNTVVGSGSDIAFLYDYDIGQVFAEATLPLGHVPLNLFADFARNFEADNDLDTAYSLGLLIGKASEVGRWEAGVLTQHVEKDALFGQWTDSDFAGGVTDNDGLVYRVAWMPVTGLVVNLTYLDTRFNVDAGDEVDYDRWQLDFNFPL
jgi:hypothetical protein